MIWLLELTSCAAMTGIIWLVQLLIYPGFEAVSPERFAQIHARHGQRITWVVGPLMILELATASVLLFTSPDWPHAVSIASVGALWLLTAFVSVPIHNQLERGGANATLIHRLVATNWWRTLIWTARLVFLLSCVAPSTLIV